MQGAKEIQVIHVAQILGPSDDIPKMAFDTKVQQMIYHHLDIGLLNACCWP